MLLLRWRSVARFHHDATVISLVLHFVALASVSRPAAHFDLIVHERSVLTRGRGPVGTGVLLICVATHLAKPALSWRSCDSARSAPPGGLGALHRRIENRFRVTSPIILSIKFPNSRSVLSVQYTKYHREALADSSAGPTATWIPSREPSASHHDKDLDGIPYLTPGYILTLIVS